MRRLAVAVAFAAAVLGCRKHHEPKSYQISIHGMQFVPASLDVDVGDTVVWTNEDVLPHTVTSDVPSSETFDSHSIDATRQWQYTVSTAGEIAYMCTFHPTMHGKLIVH